jgi:hypothetical protein
MVTCASKPSSSIFFQNVRGKRNPPEALSAIRMLSGEHSPDLAT